MRLVAGYAYLGGFDGGEADALVIVLLDPSGKARLEERTQRTGFNGTDTQAKPKVNGLFFDDANARLVVRISGEWKTGEAWWTYSLASGEPELRLFPRSKMGRDEHLG